MRDCEEELAAQLIEELRKRAGSIVYILHSRKRASKRLPLDFRQFVAQLMKLAERLRGKHAIALWIPA